MQRSKLPYFFLILAALLAISAVALLILKPGVPKQPPVVEKPSPSTPSEQPPAALPESPAKDPAAALKNLPAGQSLANPEDLSARIGKALETGDLSALGVLLGKDALDPETAERLKSLLGAGPLKIRPEGIRQVGELELNQLARWVIELDGREPGRDRIYLDLRRKDGKWHVEKVTLPPAAGEAVPSALLSDSLGIADSFLQNVLSQNFDKARALVDSATVSDAKIAGLCIIFEEGQYRLRSEKPLRSMFQRPDAVGYLANVETPEAAKTAQFSLTVTKASDAAPWRVAEINLDALLADYAQRVAGGDIYYSPLVKNPAGGDTLALYFAFDEDVINPRTRRQLEIVALILKSDAGKKIHLSGHTDALGPDDYNNQLSSRRAVIVRDFLIKSGVSAAQISTIAEGARQPRRPNVTETGTDNPEGRRANRRTEIYLDF